MKKLDIFKIIIIIFAILLSLWYLKPTFQFFSMSPEEKAKMDPYKLDRLKDKILNLGLDLQGGMHLVLEADMSKLKEKAEAEDVIDRAIEVIRNRIDQYGVSEPVIQKQGRTRIIVELPGLQDKQRAKELIGRTALLEFILLEDPELFSDLIDKIDMYLAKKAKPESTQNVSLTAQESKQTNAENDSLEDLTKMLEEEEAKTEELGGEKPFSSLLVSWGGDIYVSEENIPKVKNCLLYTSPSPRDLSTSRMPSSA